ncbi:hypothetical protein [Desulfovibrio sp. JC022]|uniref:hypothetical protein n=1 Tax=Desulfovibrio sp. JC022 TaxID=2593642 RepID=UPI0013D1D9FC|nr:hypothetical protein [Desulfovibrio sp. JC022]NDV21320.1 hypothetical protein [Desulfovibrio sp. JC022]
MNKEHEELKSIYIGYHPRAHDGSSPQSRSRSDSIAIMDAFNKKQGEGSLRAEVVEIAFFSGDLCAVTVMEDKIGKVWQYL